LVPAASRSIWIGGRPDDPQSRAADYDNHQNIYPLVQLGDRAGDADAYNNTNDRRNQPDRPDLGKPFGGIDQTVLSGSSRNRNHRLTGTFLDGRTTPVSDPTVDKDVIFASTAADANGRMRPSPQSVPARSGAPTG
jgi:hypothetical protein